MAAIDAALDGQGPAGDAGAGGRAVPAAAELGGDVVDVHGVGFGAQADAGQFRFHFLKNAGDDHRLNGAKMVNQALGVVAVGAGSREIAVLEPELGDAVVVQSGGNGCRGV